MLEVENPATGETLAEVPDLGADAIAAMVATARAAQPGWEEMGFEGRGEALLRARAWLMANAERVVATICAETGRPVDETQFTELSYGPSALEFWAKRARPPNPAERPSTGAIATVHGRSPM
jgi:acyl-CoA reductase-like NAD-dependent aldehyde dehydrogenase